MINIYSKFYLVSNFKYFVRKMIYMIDKIIKYPFNKNTMKY